MLARTMNLRPRNLLIVFAFAGDSTITSARLPFGAASSPPSASGSASFARGSAAAGLPRREGRAVPSAFGLDLVLGVFVAAMGRVEFLWRRRSASSAFHRLLDADGG